LIAHTVSHEQIESKLGCEGIGEPYRNFDIARSTASLFALLNPALIMSVKVNWKIELIEMLADRLGRVVDVDERVLM